MYHVFLFHIEELLIKNKFEEALNLIHKKLLDFVLETKSETVSIFQKQSELLMHHWQITIKEFESQKIEEEEYFAKKQTLISDLLKLLKNLRYNKEFVDYLSIMEEAQLWNMIKSCPSVVPITNFLRKFPESIYKAEATKLLAEIENENTDNQKINDQLDLIKTEIQEIISLLRNEENLPEKNVSRELSSKTIRKAIYIILGIIFCIIASYKVYRHLQYYNLIKKGDNYVAINDFYNAEVAYREAENIFENKLLVHQKLQNIDTLKQIAWWQNLPKEWQLVLSENLNFNMEPTNKNLFTIITIDSLNCSNNLNITSLFPLTELTNIKILICNNTNIKTLEPIKNCKLLEKLNIENTKISTIDEIINFRNLKELNCSKTNLTNYEALENLKLLQILVHSIENEEVINQLKNKLPQCQFFFQK